MYGFIDYSLPCIKRDAEDAFNFYLSSLRIHVEQAFGIMVARWGILWKPLAFDLHRNTRIICAIMKLHNFCIDEKDEVLVHGTERNVVMETATRDWYDRVKQSFGDNTRSQGRRCDLEKSMLRRQMVNVVSALGLSRPSKDRR